MDPRGNQNIGHIADSLFGTIAMPVSVAGLEFVIKPSIGIAIYPDHGFAGDELIEKADTAMYQAKKSSRGVVFFDPQKVGVTA